MTHVPPKTTLLIQQVIDLVQVQIYVLADSLYPDKRAESARHKKAKKDVVMAAAEESVNISSAPSLILFVMGIAVDADDIKRYAAI